MSTAIPPATALQQNLARQPNVKPRLLVSVRNGHEAQLAHHSGVAWIDLKNPDGGSLGAADEATAAAVALELHASDGSGERLMSAAVGELRDAPTPAAVSLARYFPLLKVGLSALRDAQDWPNQLTQLARTVKQAGGHLVPVVYADHVACHAPTPAHIIEVARTLDERAETPPATLAESPGSGSDGATSSSPPRYLLVDTFTKDGRRLLDWMELAELESIVQQAAAGGLQTVVAGSLALQDLPHLINLPLAAIAVRGAVCAGDRRSGLCPEKLRQWVELFSAR